MRTEAIEAGTGRSWLEWLAFFERIGAHALPHAEIAAQVAADAGPSLSGWWAQAVTIHYEQETGRRVEGQVGTGDFAASASKTLTGSLDDVAARWRAHVASRTAAAGGLTLAGVLVDGEARESSTPKWRYWRCELVDGSRVSVTVSARTPEKSVLAVQNDGLESLEARDARKIAWKAELVEL